VKTRAASSCSRATTKFRETRTDARETVLQSGSFAQQKGVRPPMSADKERRIRERAYRIWEDEGKPSGREKEHWRRARREIEEEDGFISGDQDLRIRENPPNANFDFGSILQR
jgi:hypothetical protein